MIGIINKTWYRGDTARLKFGIGGVNLSAAAVKIQVKRSVDSSVLLDSTDTGTITKTWANNETVIEWVVPASATQELKDEYIYDVQTTLAGDVKTWVKGKIKIDPDITN